MKDELPSDLLYHKPEHSLDVLEAVERIAKAEKIIFFLKSTFFNIFNILCLQYF